MNENIKTYYAKLYELACKGYRLTEGEHYAMNAYRYSLDKQSSEFECNELPWSTDMKDFVKSLRKAGATQIAVTDRSTALMESLHKLAEQGCTIESLCTVTRENAWCGKEEAPAIRINLN